MPIDFVKRFALTPIQTTVHWSGKVISFVTNSSILLDRIASLGGEELENGIAKIDCSWRVVAELDDDERTESGALIDRFVSDEDISFVTIGRGSFLAYDSSTSKGISFVSERLVQDPTLFAEYFLPALATLLQGGKR